MQSMMEVTVVDVCVRWLKRNRLKTRYAISNLQLCVNDCYRVDFTQRSSRAIFSYCESRQ